MDDDVSVEGRAILDRILAELRSVPDDDVPVVAGTLIRLAHDLLGPDLWSITLEGLFVGSAREILEWHVRQDEQPREGAADV